VASLFFSDLTTASLGAQDLDENARRIAMAMKKAAEETIPEKEMITKK